jgi:macrolide transport system ATP-binding/permease protein
MAELLSTLLQDLRFAIRQLRKSPGFTLTAILVFALGIAASTAIFAFVDAALVRPLPYRAPSQLVALFEHIPVGDRFHISYGDYLDWKQRNHTLSSLDAYRPSRLTLKTPAGGEEVLGAVVSAGFFRTLGVVPFLGRDFMPGEDLPSAQHTVILSYTCWQKRFGANANVLGQPVTLDGHSAVVVGVLPPGFHFAPTPAAEYWITLRWMLPMDERVGHPFYGIARLKPNTSMLAARADLASIAQQIALQYPHTNRDRTATVMPLTDLIVGDVRPTLFALLLGAGLLSLIGFANISSLLFVRAASRRREIAVRGALGASHARLVCQFTVEGFLLAGSGCMIGLVLAWCSLSILTTWIPRALLDGMPYLDGLHFDLHLLLFALAISACGGILFSAGPSLQLFLSNMQEGLVEGGRTAAGLTWRRVGATLVVIELAFTVVLLVSGGLLAKSFYRLVHEDLGMSADHLAVLHAETLDDLQDSQLIAIERKIRYGITALPGVIAVGNSDQLAIGSGERYTSGFAHFRVIGKAYLGEGDEADQHSVSVGYFETLQARLLHGRYFSEQDDISKPSVALINRTMAQRIFPGEEVLGKTILNEFYAKRPFQIIGIVDDIQDGPLDAKPVPVVYIALNQNPTSDFYVTVRTAPSAGNIFHAMATVIHQAYPGLIVDDEETMTDRINNSESAYLHRIAASIVAAFASLALLLGTVGLYGVISYSVGQRTREIGVRMALGAQRANVYQLILKETCWLTVVGILAGLLSFLLSARILRSMLFAVSPWDAANLSCVVGVLVASALLASFLPARRAASLNPTEALRSE